MNLELMVRTAVALPKGHPTRRALIASIRVAVSPDTEDFVEWVLATRKAMTEDQVQAYLEQKSGRTPTETVDRPAATRGPLNVGEKVYIDRNKNTNTLNVDACEKYHLRVGQVGEPININAVTSRKRQA